MRDRLIELLVSAPRTDVIYAGTKVGTAVDFPNIADYLLTNGVIVPPCKVGDTVFYVNEICDENANEYLDISVGEVVSFSIQKEGLWAYCRYEDGLTYWHLVADDFGKTVFLTKEEAKAALVNYESSKNEKGGTE